MWQSESRERQKRASTTQARPIRGSPPERVSGRSPPAPGRPAGAADGAAAAEGAAAAGAEGTPAAAAAEGESAPPDAEGKAAAEVLREASRVPPFPRENLPGKRRRRPHKAVDVGTWRKQS